MRLLMTSAERQALIAQMLKEHAEELNGLSDADLLALHPIVRQTQQEANRGAQQPRQAHESN
jgi:hypothetical protein